jgi:hypothetical protein
MNKLLFNYPVHGPQELVKSLRGRRELPAGRAQRTLYTFSIYSLITMDNMDQVDQANNDKGFSGPLKQAWSSSRMDRGWFGNLGLFRWPGVPSTVKRPGVPVRNAVGFSPMPPKIHTALVRDDLRLNVAQYPTDIKTLQKPDPFRSSTRRM